MATAILVGAEVTSGESRWVRAGKVVVRWFERRWAQTCRIIDIPGLEEALIRIGIANM